MPTRHLLRRATVLGSARADQAPIYVDSDDNRIKIIPSGSGTTEVVIQEAGGAAFTEVLTAATTLDASDSGKVFILALAAGFAVTLPSPAVGLNYKFFMQIAPTGDMTIVSAAQDLAGQVYASSGGDEDSETAFTATTITFVAAAGAGKIGDSADLWSDGTSWYARCFCDTAGGITITG